MRRDNGIKVFLILSFLVVITLSASDTATGAVGRISSLDIPNRDYFQDDIRRGKRLSVWEAFEWGSPPIAGRMIDYGFAARRGKLRFFNDFTVLGNVVITENDLGAGASVVIKARGTQNKFTYLLTERTAFSFSSRNVTVKTTAPTVAAERVFRGRQYGLKHRWIPNGQNRTGAMAEYRYMDNNVDDFHYLALTVSHPFGRRFTSTIGVDYAGSSAGVSSTTGVIAGGRFIFTKWLQGYIIYDSADPTKIIYNNHLLQLVDGVGEIYCADCSNESLTAGVSFQPAPNLALNVAARDLTDLSFPSVSMLYIVKGD